MSTPSLSDHLALMVADPALTGHPVVAKLVTAVETLERELAAVHVDSHVDHWPDRCRGCGAVLSCTDAGTPARRQVHDLPPSFLAMTEHRAHAVRCPDCGTRMRAAFPADVAGPVLFSLRLEALATYLRYPAAVAPLRPPVAGPGGRGTAAARSALTRCRRWRTAPPTLRPTEPGVAEQLHDGNLEAVAAYHTPPGSGQ